MKHTKKSFVSALLAIAMIITCFLSFGSTCATATTSPPTLPNGATNADIYYFSDLYPSLNETELTAAFGNRSVFYDRQLIDQQTFTAMVQANYFTGFDTNTVVIIDIKTFAPTVILLQELFDYLHEDQGCITVFVSPYSDQNYTSLKVLGYLDLFYLSNMSRLSVFCQNVALDLHDRNGEINNTCILIDGNLVKALDFDEDDINTLCANSTFFRYLFTYFGLYDVTFLVHTGGNQYVDILNWVSYNADSVELLLSELEGVSHVCGIGFWELDSDFYSFLLAGQETYGVGNLPIYVLEADAFGEEGGDGLLTSDSRLESLYRTSDEADLFLEALQRLLYEKGWL